MPKCFCGKEAKFRVIDLKKEESLVFCSRHFIQFAEGFKTGYILGFLDALKERLDKMEERR